MSIREVWISDLTHTAQGVSAATFPLGASYVLSYAKQELGKECNFRLFKFPSHLNHALRDLTPAMLCFSSYSWNFELAYKFAALAKIHVPDIVTVFGGPNFPTNPGEKMALLQARPAIDFYVELEGELGFVDLTRKLIDHDFDADSLKSQGDRPLNTTYISGGQLVSGIPERIRDINSIPSPYLSGELDEYFDLPLVPMIETTRGCPFSCSFCADGIATKNKVTRYDSQRTKDELNYIASRVQNVDELIITDLNFAMYKADLATAEAVASTQRTYQYPVIVSAAAGKNKPERIIEAAGIMKGWTLSASIQSTDAEVLAAIKRSNISSSAYQTLIEFGNSLKNGRTDSEIILGLPGDTKEKHFESLRFAIENDVSSIRMFQAIMLVGTEMATRATRQEYGLMTKFRTIPGSIGNYDLLGGTHSVAEIEEIIVGSKSMSLPDYVDCRIMNLIVETFHNNAIFDEVFAIVRAIGASPFDCLLYLKDHPELYPPEVSRIVDEFVSATTNDLFDSFEEASEFVLVPEILDKYVGGELGTNELLVHRAMLFNEFESICNLLVLSIKKVLEQQGLADSRIEAYLEELKVFTILRKKSPFDHTEDVSSATFNYDFEAIRDADYRIDPTTFPPSTTPMKFDFYHDEAQRLHIANQVRIYANHPVGLGKLIQNSNLKLVFRSFAVSSETQ